MSYSDDTEELASYRAWDSEPDDLDDELDDELDDDTEDDELDDEDDEDTFADLNGYDLWPTDAYGNLLRPVGQLEQPTVPYTPPHARASASVAHAQRRASVAATASAPTQFPVRTENTRRRGGHPIVTLLCTLALVVLLGALTVLFVSRQLAAPVGASQAFCADLQQQRYDAAYALVGPQLHASYTRAQFDAANMALDAAEGRVLACTKTGAASADHLIYVNSTAAVPLTITRERQGTLTGSLHLIRQHGAWQIGSIDLPLLGVDLGALNTTLDYCTALRQRQYTAAYALLASSQQKQVTAADFTAAETMHDRVDGRVTRCAVVAINPGNTATAASLQVSITRATLGLRTGAVRLAREAAGWRIRQSDAPLAGTNITPLVTGNQFCADIAHGDLAHAYTLTASAYQQQTSQSDFTTLFDAGSDYTFGACQPNLKSYKVATSSASYGLTLALVPVDPTFSQASVALTLTFAYENDTWKISQIGIGA